MTPVTSQPDAIEDRPLSKRGGAPAGNVNRTRHGLRGSGLPRGCGHIHRSTNEFRRAIEAAVLEARGEISLVDASFINTCFRSERHGQLAQRWLLLEAENMTPADRLSYSREVVRASESRDKALAALNLPKRPDADEWSFSIPAPASPLDSRTEPHTSLGSDDTPEGDSASDGVPGPHNSQNAT